MVIMWETSTNPIRVYQSGKVRQINSVTENEPVTAHADEFGGSGPGGGGEVLALRGQQVTPPEDVQIESSDGHDRVVGVLLKGYQQLARLVPDKHGIAIRRAHASELRWAGGGQGYVLDIRIVLGRVGDEMMDVVTRLPPSDGQSTTEVSDEDADEGIGDKFPHDPTVSGVVGSEHDLLPKEAEEPGRPKVPPGSKGDEELGKQRRILTHLIRIVDIVATVIPLVVNTLIERLEPLDNDTLGPDVGRRVGCETLVHLGLHGVVDMVVSGLVVCGLALPGLRPLQLPIHAFVSTRPYRIV